MTSPSQRRRQQPGISRRKTLSQNFLRAGEVVADFVAQARIATDDVVVEIGGGAGAITRELAKTGATLTVIERDPAHASGLREAFSELSRVRIIEADVREFRWPHSTFRVVGNLPFGITTEILRVLFEGTAKDLTRADLIVQAEVATKRAAPPEGNKLNLLWAPWWCFEAGRAIPAACFTPRPRVDAAVLIARRRSSPLIREEERALWKGIIEMAFSRGGEPIRRSLAPVLTSTQLRRAGSGRWEPSTPTSRLPLRAWLDIHGAVRDYAPREKWPSSAKSRRRARSRDFRRH